MFPLYNGDKLAQRGIVAVYDAQINLMLSRGAMKIRVDRESCEANGVCVKLSPDDFELDDEDVLHVRVNEVPPEREERVRRAVAKCPKQALSIEE